MGSNIMKSENKSNKKYDCIDIETIQKFKLGCTSSANKLILFYGKRIEAAVRYSYSVQNLGGYICTDDLVQEAYIHFLDAAECFEIDKYEDHTSNVNNFFNFCIKKTNWRLLDYIRLLRRRYKIDNANLKNDDNHSEYLSSDPLPDVLFKKSIEKALNSLSKRDRIICSEIMRTEVISKKTIKKIGLHKTYCFSIYRNFKNKLISNAIDQSL